MFRQLKLFTAAITFVLLLAMLVGCAGTTPTPTSIGRILFISERDGNIEIYVMDADGSNQTNLTNNPADDYSPVWSP